MKKNKKTFNISKKILQLLNALSVLFLAYSIYLVNGIENELRYLAIIDIFLINIFLFFFFNNFIGKSKIKTILFYTISIIVICIQGILGYYIYNVYSAIDNMNKDIITYKTVLVSLKDSKYLDISSVKDSKIGIISDETSINGYIMPKEVITKNNLSKNNQITNYDDFSSLINALYNKEIDLIFISDDYVSMFIKNEGYENIETDTKIINSYEKKYKKTEIEKLTTTDTDEDRISTSASIDKPFTVLFMGIDTTDETLSKNATGNGDALILITFNPKTLNITMVSIPRDSYVPIACFSGQRENKITHAGWSGESCMMKTIQNFTGVKIDYYVKINFKGVVKLVDTLGGIEINSDYDFCVTSNSSRKRANICFKKGIQAIDGEGALAFSRERHSFLTGDLQRGLNQQIVIKAVLNKLRTIKSANDAMSILNTISNSIDTSFTTDQILSFYNIFKDVYINNTNNSTIDIQQMFLYGSNQSIYDESMKRVLSNYIVNTSSLKQVVNAMKENLEITEPELIKDFDFNIEETYKKTIIGKNPGAGTSTYSLLPNFVNNTVSYATSWLSSNGISYSIEYETGDEDGTVISQSLPAKKRIDLINKSSGIVLTVTKKVVAPVVTKPEQSETNPEQGGSQTNPEQGDSETNPEQGDSETNPEQGGSQTNPEQNGDNTNP